MVTSYPPIPSSRPATVSIIPSAENRWELIGHYCLVLFFSVLGTLLTWTGHNVLHMNKIMASSMVGLIAYCIYPRYSPPAYAGSFAGMATTVVIPQAYWALVLSVFVFSFFAVFDRFGILQGIGGRLGTTALASCLLMVPVLYWVVPDYEHTFWVPDRYGKIDVLFGCVAVALSAVTSFVTILARGHIKTLEHPVPSASIVALCCSFVILPLDYVMKEELLVWVYIGMSVGMSGRDVVKGYPTYLFLGALVGALGLAFYGLSTGDNGGMAGFTAMVGVVFWVYLWLPIYRRLMDYFNPSSSYASLSVRGRRKSILRDLEEPVLLSTSVHSVWSSQRISEDRAIENSIRGRLSNEDSKPFEEGDGSSTPSSYRGRASTVTSFGTSPEDNNFEQMAVEEGDRV